MPKLLPEANAIAQAWLTQASKLQAGEELYLEVKTKPEQKSQVKLFKELIAKLARDEPVVASKLSVTYTTRDRRMWVVIKMEEISPLTGYVKGKDGSLEVLSVTVDPDRKRRIKLMVSDGIPKDQINEMLDSPMTRAEERQYIEKGRFT